MDLKTFQKKYYKPIDKIGNVVYSVDITEKPTNHVGNKGNVKGEIVMIKIYSKLTVANIKNQRMCFRCYM